MAEKKGIDGAKAMLEWYTQNDKMGKTLIGLLSKDAEPERISDIIESLESKGLYQVIVVLFLSWYSRRLEFLEDFTLKMALKWLGEKWDDKVSEELIKALEEDIEEYSGERER